MSTTIQPTADLAELFKTGGVGYTNMRRSPSTFVERPNENGYDAFSLETAQQVTNMAMLIPEPEETRFNKKEAASVIGSTARRASFDNSKAAAHTFFPEAVQEARKTAEQVQTPKQEHFQRNVEETVKTVLVAMKKTLAAQQEQASKKAIELSKAQASFFFATKEDGTSCVSEAQQEEAAKSAIITRV